jgi:hypothetical protein
LRVIASASLELRLRLREAPELRQQVRRARTPAGGIRAATRPSSSIVDQGQPRRRPSAIATATARLSSTTGEPVTRDSVAYSPAMRRQSVASAVAARA